TPERCGTPRSLHPDPETNPRLVTRSDNEFRCVSRSLSPAIRSPRPGQVYRAPVAATRSRSCGRIGLLRRFFSGCHPIFRLRRLPTAPLLVCVPTKYRILVPSIPALTRHESPELFWFVHVRRPTEAECTRRVTLLVTPLPDRRPGGARQ